MIVPDPVALTVKAEGVAPRQTCWYVVIEGVIDNSALTETVVVATHPPPRVYVIIEDPWVLPATVNLVKLEKSGFRLMFPLDVDQGLAPVGVPDPINVISELTQTEVGPVIVG